ncbi:unnamed protein product [Sphagnum jensenii]|uniref:Amino acid permease n=1 Tax=Sphagnum jensenii TaxID=128206 RepID=A0ABP0VH67_9BRYO
MSLFDLLCVGVGGTIGTGVFVLSGLIAKEYSGPSAMFSFLIAGFACLISAASYGELSSRIPTAGSSYVYAYAALGEYPAVIAAWSLSLEYGLSGAAVSRSWGDKLATWVSSFGVSISTPLDAVGINLFAGFLMITCVLILLGGMNTGKITVNVFTVFKVLLVFFMMFGGFSQFQAQNLTPLVPLGYGGILRGATSCFFGYVGFDEV